MSRTSEELILTGTSSTDSQPLAGPLTVALDNNHVRLQAACWSCGTLVRKLVPRRSRSHQHFHWNCDGCEVGWEGPGIPAQA